MRKFSDFGGKKIRKINEDKQTDAMMQPVAGQDGDPVVANLPQNIEQPQEGEIAGTVESNDVSKFFSKLFESREMAHVYHLQVRGDEGSYAAHMALGSYYEEVVDLIDDCIEVYQGQYGLIEGYDIIDTKDTKTKEYVAYFEEVAEFVKHSRKSISEEDTHLHSIIDDIVCLIYKTLYKLKFNK